MGSRTKETRDKSVLWMSCFVEETLIGSFGGQHVAIGENMMIDRQRVLSERWKNMYMMKSCVLLFSIPGTCCVEHRSDHLSSSFYIVCDVRSLTMLFYSFPRICEKQDLSICRDREIDMCHITLGAELADMFSVGNMYMIGVISWIPYITCDPGRGFHSDNH